MHQIKRLKEIQDRKDGQPKMLKMTSNLCQKLGTRVRAVVAYTSENEQI